MGTYLSTHAIASQAQSRCLNGNLTRLDSAAKAARGVFKLGYGKPFLITAKRASLVLRVEFGDRRNWQSQSPKGATPLFLYSSEASNASFCLGSSPTKGGLTVAPFGISVSRNRQTPPNCPKFSGSGYVQTVALGKNCNDVRTADWRKLPLCGDRSIGEANLRKGLAPSYGWRTLRPPYQR